MIIRSPIGQFVTLLEKVNKSAILHKKKLERNEAATRAVLIDPVIQALGWDITNPNMVEFEKTYQDTRVDYALYGVDEKIKIIVEAKALGVNLNNAKNAFKLYAYAFKFEIDRVVLTNGITWQLFSRLQPDNQEPLILNLNQGPVVEVAAHLIESLDAAKFWSLPVKGPENSTVIIERDDFIKLSNLELPLKGKNAPKKIKMPDGTVKTIRYWRDILSECSKFVLSNNPNLRIPFADKAGKKLKLFDWIEPQGSVTYEKIPYNGKSVFIYENYSADGCVKNAQHVLKSLPMGKGFCDVAVSF